MALDASHRKMVAIVVVILASSMMLPFFASAQSQTTRDVLEVTVNPQAPTPGGQTTITIGSSDFDAGTADFAWTINGAPDPSSGPGARSLTFTMGPVGKATVVGVSIRPKNADPVQRTFTFRPGGVVLLWDADSYVPPFYLGKALYSAGSTIRVVAYTDIKDSAGKQIDPKDLTFKWQRNGTAFADHSGIGRTIFDFTGNGLGGPEDISVDVIRKDGLKAGSGFVEIADTPPLALLYKRDPLRGTLYGNALVNHAQFDETETTVVAEPYYMSGKSRSQKNFTYDWTLNSQPITPQGSDPGVLTLRQKTTQTGSAELSVAIQNTSSGALLQQAHAVLTLILGGAKTDFFGI